MLVAGSPAAQTGELSSQPSHGYRLAATARMKAADQSFMLVFVCWLLPKMVGIETSGSYAIWSFNMDRLLESSSNRSEGFPARDIWFLGTLEQGSAQIPEFLGNRRRRRRRRHRRQKWTLRSNDMLWDRQKWTLRSI